MGMDWLRALAMIHIAWPESQPYDPGNLVKFSRTHFYLLQHGIKILAVPNVLRDN